MSYTEQLLTEYGLEWHSNGGWPTLNNCVDYVLKNSAHVLDEKNLEVSFLERIFEIEGSISVYDAPLFLSKMIPEQTVEKYPEWLFGILTFPYDSLENPVDCLLRVENEVAFFVETLEKGHPMFSSETKKYKLQKMFKEIDEWTVWIDIGEPALYKWVDALKESLEWKQFLAKFRKAVQKEIQSISGRKST